MLIASLAHPRLLALLRRPEAPVTGACLALLAACIAWPLFAVMLLGLFLLGVILQNLRLLLALLGLHFAHRTFAAPAAPTLPQPIRAE